MRISDWSSDVCSSDLSAPRFALFRRSIERKRRFGTQRVPFESVSASIIIIRGAQHALRTVRDESAGNRRKIGRGAANEGRRRRSKTRRQSVSRKKGQRIERRGETSTALKCKKKIGRAHVRTT